MGMSKKLDDVFRILAAETHKQMVKYDEDRGLTERDRLMFDKALKGYRQTELELTESRRMVREHGLRVSDRVHIDAATAKGSSKRRGSPKSSDVRDSNESPVPRLPSLCTKSQ
jgi:hypothetical protein